MGNAKKYTTTQLIILAALKKLIEQYGYAYAYIIMQRTTLPESTVPPILKQFVDAGMLSVKIVTVNGRRRHHHTWTQEGREELDRLGEVITKLEANL